MTIFSYTFKNIRTAPNKINYILLKIRKKSYLEVLKILKNTSRKVNIFVLRILQYAILNSKLPKNSIIIKEIFVNQGSILKRRRTRAKGKSFPIEKKMSHLTIFVC
jgi:large subunit ribosomal protein L22